MPVDGTIELVSNEQQPSSDLTQSNNGNDRSLTSTSVVAQEKSISITDLLENKVAKMLGAVACGWALAVLVQGGLVGSLETKDCGFVTLLFFLAFFRCWRHYCPEAYRSFTDATQSLSTDNLAQQLVLPSCYIRRLFYCSSLVCAMTSVVLSVMRLASQNFGKKEVENKESRDFALKVFYGLTLAEALVLLFAEVLSFPIRWNSVGLADGPGDDLEVGLRTRENSVGLADRPGDGLEVGLVTRENSVGLVDGQEDEPEDGLTIRGDSVGLADGPGDGPEDGPGDGPENEPGDGPEDGYEVVQMALPTNQSNDCYEAYHLPTNLRQRRVMC